MRYFLFATLLLLALAAPAQTVPAPAGPVAYRYCALVVDDLYFASANTMSLDYGYRKSFGQADATLEAAGQLFKKNRSVIFALNYLSDLGWECFNVTTVTVDASHRNIETRYLLRRPK